MPIYYKNTELGSAREAIELMLQPVQPKPKLFNADDKLFVVRIMEITNNEDEDYIIKLLCFDKDMRRRIVHVHSESLDWLDFIATDPRAQDEESAKTLATLLETNDVIGRTEIIKGRWVSIGCEDRWWVRAHLNYFMRKRGFLNEIKLLNEMIIGNNCLPTKSFNFLGKVRIAGVPMFEWFSINNHYYDGFSGRPNTYMHKVDHIETGFIYYDDNGISYEYNDRHMHWVDDSGNEAKAPLDKETIHVRLEHIKVDPQSEQIKAVYPWVCHDIEVFNSNVLEYSNIPLVRDLDSQINAISFLMLNNDKVLKRFSVSMSPFTNLKCIDDVICVNTEKELIECVVWMFSLSQMVYLADYNGLAFDNPWLSHRITLHGFQELFIELFDMTHTNRHLIDIMTRRIKSASAGKDRHGSKDEGVSLRTKYFAHIDFMHYVATREIYDKRTGRSLNAVAAHFGLGQKLEVEHWRVSLITVMYNAIFASNEPRVRAGEMMQQLHEAIAQFRVKATALKKPEYVALQKGNLKLFKNTYQQLMTHYVDYCIMDVELCVNLILKNDLYETFHGMGRIYALPAETILYNGVNVTINNLLLMFMWRNNFTFHTLADDDITRRESSVGNINQIGGITLDVYEQDLGDPIIAVGEDLSQAYPSSIADFNISPEMIVHPIYNAAGAISMPWPHTVYNLFDNSGNPRTFIIRDDIKGVMAMFEDSMIDLRNQYKRQMKTHIKNGAPDYVIKAADVNQRAIKLVANAAYGQFGSEYNKESWLHSSACSSMTTVSTAMTIILVIMTAFLEYGAVPMIGVTDSATFRIEKRWCRLFGLDDSCESRYQIAKRVCNAMAARFNRMIKEFCGGPKKLSCIATEYIGSSLIIHKMKRYGIRKLKDSKPTYKEAHEAGSDKIVGYSQVRQNTSLGIRTLSSDILDMALGYERLTHKILIDHIMAYVDDTTDEHFRWSNFERVSTNSPSMRQFQLRSAILYMTDLGYAAPPIFGSQVHVIPVDYGCRCVAIGGTMQTDWPIGMLYMDSADAARMGLKVYKAKIYDRIVKVCDEILGRSSEVSMSIKDIMKKRTSETRSAIPKKPQRVEAQQRISADIDEQSLRYVSLDLLRTHTTAYLTLAKRRLEEIDQNYIANGLLMSNPILNLAVVNAQTKLEEKLPMRFGGLIGEITIHLSLLSSDPAHADTKHYRASMGVIKRMMLELDDYCTKVLETIKI